MTVREYGPGRPLVFNHIPKTAGTSLTAGLHRLLDPAVFVTGIDRSLAGALGDFRDFSAKMQGLTFDGPEDLAADATLVAGHISPATTLARYPGGDHLTILRDPRTRVLSQWVHTRSRTEFNIRHWASGGEAFRAGWGSFRAYLQNPVVAANTDNTIARFLAWPHPAVHDHRFLAEEQDLAVLEAALERLARFAHTDVVENRGFLDRLSEWLGAPVPLTRLNERQTVPAWRRPDFDAELDPETRALLDHRTRLDREIWAHVAHRCVPGQPLDEVLAESFRATVHRYRAMPRDSRWRDEARRAAHVAWRARRSATRRSRS